MKPSGILCPVVWQEFTHISEQCIALFFKAEEQAKQTTSRAQQSRKTMLAVCCLLLAWFAHRLLRWRQCIPMKEKEKECKS
jgi:hypothetical protein